MVLLAVIIIAGSSMLKEFTGIDVLESNDSTTAAQR
jgi:hypothetical protein